MRWRRVQRVRSHARPSKWTCVQLALAFAISAPARAEIQVAFFSTPSKSGKAVEFEPGGQYSHVAISYNGGWIHASPVRGVEFVQSLEKIGHVSRVLSNSSIPGLSTLRVARLLGLPYDRTFAWNRKESTYCSKLVGELLGVTPLPMSFNGSGWIGIRDLPRGISPFTVERF